MACTCGVDGIKIGSFTGKVELSDGIWVCMPHWKQAGFSTLEATKYGQQLTIDRFKEILESGHSGKEYLTSENKTSFHLSTNALIQPNEIGKLQIAIARDWESNEEVLIALKGAFKEYLIVTRSYLYIFKSGFMTGHFVGQNRFKMPIANITNVEVDTHLLTGYFEVAAGGVQNLPRNYWSTDSKTDPAKSPNTISLNSNLFDDFRKASDLINELIMDIKLSPSTSAQSFSKLDTPDELRKYKSLLDDGIINEQEFNAKKKQLLGL